MVKKLSANDVCHGPMQSRTAAAAAPVDGERCEDIENIRCSSFQSSHGHSGVSWGQSRSLTLHNCHEAATAFLLTAPEEQKIDSSWEMNGY